jgi:hypothetical protein
MKKFAIAMLLLATSSANAVIQDVTANQIAGSIIIPTTTDTVFFSPAPADLILYGENADWNPQEPAHIETVLEGEIGADIYLISEGSLPDWGTSGTLDTNGNVFYFHFGDNALAFGYKNPQPQSFDFSNLPNDISNYRIFGCVDATQCGGLTTTRTGEVPVPAAAWLFGTGLMSLAGVARKRKITSA